VGRNQQTDPRRRNRRAAGQPCGATVPPADREELPEVDAFLRPSRVRFKHE
jgi:hypothetical protein